MLPVQSEPAWVTSESSLSEIRPDQTLIILAERIDFLLERHRRHFRDAAQHPSVVPRSAERGILPTAKPTGDHSRVFGYRASTNAPSALMENPTWPGVIEASGELWRPLAPEGRHSLDKIVGGRTRSRAEGLQGEPHSLP